MEYVNGVESAKSFVGDYGATVLSHDSKVTHYHPHCNVFVLEDPTCVLQYDASNKLQSFRSTNKAVK